jgi:ferredoxin
MVSPEFGNLESQLGGEALKVEFRKSGKVVEWQDRFESILELAEDEGIQIPFECRQGFCGECKIKMISGEVSMEETQGLENGDETGNVILPCVAIPVTDVILES